MSPSDFEADKSIQSHLIVTPARNEAESLQRLGACLVEQTWRPDAWIVVDNGSTDGTPEVVRELGRVHDWIRLVSISSDANPARGRSNARAFNAGVMGDPGHADLVTGLDADVSFGPDYLDSLRRAFQRNPRLGVGSRSRSPEAPRFLVITWSRSASAFSFSVRSNQPPTDWLFRAREARGRRWSSLTATFALLVGKSG